MSGSIFGKIFQVSTWGESHGPAIGVVIDGCPAGLPLNEANIQADLDRRKPGQSVYTTQRSEADHAQLLSGVFEGLTTGTPLSILVYNQDQRSQDYSQIANLYRPGHADYPYEQKYGFRDYRGGGRSSGRETLSRVAAGAVAKKLLEVLGVSVTAYTKAIGPVQIDPAACKLSTAKDNPLCMPDEEAAKAAATYLDTCRRDGDSAGGVVECIVTGLPVGLGEPVFYKLDAALAAAILSIGAVKGFEIGDGFATASAKGSENNDAFRMSEGRVVKETNHAGGILGGLSDGSPLVLRAAFKPTPSIAKPQKTVDRYGQETTISIPGRHDPVIVPRAVVVVEAMTALVLADLLLQNMTCRVDGIIRYYQR